MRGWAHQTRLHKSKLYVCNDKKSLPAQRTCSLSQKRVTSPFEQIFSNETYTTEKLSWKEKMRTGQVPRVIISKYIETSSSPVEGCYLGIYKAFMAVEQTETRGPRCDKGPWFCGIIHRTTQFFSPSTEDIF